MPPKTKKKGGDPSPNLPSLFPTHDGSYGINTLISPNTGHRKGQKPNTGIAKEQSDDNKWTKSMTGRVGKHGMNSNLKKAINESSKKVEEERQSQSASHHIEPSSSHPVPDRPIRDSGPISELTPHVPNYNPSHLPFSEEHDNRARPPYKPAELSSADPHAHFGFNQPISPPSEHIPFYGMPRGEGSKEPISPTRPDTSRSFNYENGLFANARLQSPWFPGFSGQGQTTGPSNPAAPFSAGIPKPNQSYSGEPHVLDSNSIGTPADSSSSSSEGQPNPRGQSSLKIPISGLRTPTNSSNSSQAPPEKFTGHPPPSKKPEQPARQDTSNVQPTPASQPPPKQDVRPNPPNSNQARQNSESKSGLPSNPPLSNQSRQDGQSKLSLPTNPPGQPPNVTKAPITNNNTKTQGQQPKPPQAVKRPVTSPRSARNGKGANQWSCPPAGVCIPPLLVFLAVVLAVWFALSSIPDDGSKGSNTGVPPSSDTPLSFAPGSVWRKISSLLPGIPALDDYTYDVVDRPGPSKSDVTNPDETTANLRHWIPESVWVQGDDNGRIRIPEDFWHALKSRIGQDDNILSLNNNSDISEEHWRAIKVRVQAAGFGTGESANSLEDLVESKLAQSWSEWLKKNDQLLKQTITGIAVTRDEFMKLYQQESASYQGEIRQEITKLQERINNMAEKLSKLSDEIISNASITKAEVTKLVDSLVAKAINRATLDAIAEGFIKGHANDVLANQVNFFGTGAGVAIDPDTSSRAWKPPNYNYLSKEWKDRDGYQRQPPMAALSPWTQEGECFCAASDRKGYGEGTNNLTMITSRDIVPQHLVVEHILPGATLDPGAMPKDIEVWVYIEEINLRKEVQSFSEKEFPDTSKEVILNDGFVKIGQFTYKNNTGGDGVQVFKISDEIAAMAAFTNRIVVRAINNYGADHTCFYRLRLYGVIREREGDPPAYTKGNIFW
ncbi:hypothetical protein F5Y03DRAFT_131626 [Xylaria venustula]|nr:hypothetical protein F5Y03DRAFT_131626 [Xylaria venustula]